MEIIAELENRRRGVYAAQSDISISPETSISASRFAPSSSKTVAPMSRRAPASSPIRTRRRNTRKRATCAGSRSSLGAGAARSLITMLLVIDNYDSFTYNLVQYLGELGADIQVHRNEITIDAVEAMKPDRIVISPGPAAPKTQALRRTSSVDLAARRRFLASAWGIRQSAWCMAARSAARTCQCTERRPQWCTTARVCSTASPNRSRPVATTFVISSDDVP